MYSEAKDAVSGPKAADAPGVTAGGQATDAHGNKLSHTASPRSTRRIATLAKPHETGLWAKVPVLLNTQIQEWAVRTGIQQGQGNKKQSSTHNNYPED